MTVLQSAPCIGIAGVGGIGSNIAANLVRSGFHNLKLVDMDVVEAGNLNRQFYFADQIGMAKVEALASSLRRIDPQAAFESVEVKIDEFNCGLLFADCPIVVEGLDDAAAKKTLLEQLTEKSLLVSACGIAGIASEPVCCRRLGNCVVVGDFVSDCSDAPLFAHKLQAVSARMSEVIIRFLKEEQR